MKIPEWDEILDPEWQAKEVNRKWSTCIMCDGSGVGSAGPGLIGAWICQWCNGRGGSYITDMNYEEFVESLIKRIA